jgi:hypothetical protein
MPSHKRVFWGYHSGIKRYQLLWQQVTRKSVVLISAAEANPPELGAFTFVPSRFVGDAVFSVENIAPQDGSVIFVIDVRWPDPLPLWTDVTLFDPSDPIDTVVVPH